MIKVCIIDNQLAKAWDFFHEMRTTKGLANLVSYILMLGVCAKKFEAEKALCLYRDLRDQGITPNLKIFTTLLHVLSKCPEYYEASLKILDVMLDEYGLSPNNLTLNVLLQLAQKNKDLELLIPHI